MNFEVLARAKYSVATALAIVNIAKKIYRRIDKLFKICRKIIFNNKYMYIDFCFFVFMYIFLYDRNRFLFPFLKFYLIYFLLILFNFCKCHEFLSCICNKHIMTTLHRISFSMLIFGGGLEFISFFHSECSQSCCEKGKIFIIVR